MKTEFTAAELEAYLDEELAADRMSEVERALRKQPELLKQLATIVARRDSGMHTLGEIWRRHQVGVPTREQLGSYLLGVLPEDHADYIRFRVETLKCRITIANLEDLEAQQQEAASHVAARRRKYFQSSAGYLQAGDA